MRRVVYLSGRIDQLGYAEAIRERQEAAEALLMVGWDVLDPTRGGVEDPKTGHFLDGTMTSGQNLDAAIIFRDLDDIRRADVIMVLTASTPSWGTAMEWSYAAIALGKPVVAVDPEHKGRQSPWCRAHCLFFADTIAEAVEWINQFLDRGYRLDDYRRSNARRMASAAAESLQ
jgi:nucleoside 2-deoxyribosyltransferase